jgi:hypothetical protein
MNPKVLKTDDEYWAARRHLDHLRNAGPGKEGEIELWLLLVARYEKGRLAGTPIVTVNTGGFKLRPKNDWEWAMGLRWKDPLSRRTCIFFGITALLIYLRLMYRVSYFPAFFEGEEAKVLDLAKDTCDYAAYTHSWWQAFVGGFIEYNKGFTWALVPFYLVFGYDVRLITYILPVFFALLCAAFFTIYRKAYPRSSLLSFVIVALFSVLCVALRRYKWHTVAYIPAISVYLYFLPEFYKGPFFMREGWRKALALLLFVVSCYLYFGSFIYALPFVALLFFFSAKLRRPRELAVGCAFTVLCAAAFSYFCYTTDRWRVRIHEEVGSILIGFSRRGLELRGYALKEFFFTHQLSLPYLILFVVGLYTSVRRSLRGDRFALISVVLFTPLFLFQMAISGLNNPDQLNWLMIPLLGILLTGADQILVPLRDKVRYGTIIGAVIACSVGWTEWNHYLPLNRDAGYQSYIQDRNTRTQLSLVLRMIRDDDSGTVQYFLPAASVPESSGGFNYEIALLRLDYVDAFIKVTYFASDDDLRRRLLAVPKNKTAVAFLSVGYPDPGEKDTLNMPLLGQQPDIIHPYEDVYEIPFLVRKFVFQGGPPEPARSQ